ncbi:MAG: PAS domain-containing protein [Cytophagales bacterium]|nr:PAS domain-containing protein [Cytophagales bacterium]
MVNIENLAEGHPVKIHFDEIKLIQKLIDEILSVDIQNDFQVFFNLFNQLSEIDKRFARKENQLFPYLEQHGWNGPSQGMWSFHDTLRAQIRLIREHIDNNELDQAEANLHHLTTGIGRLLEIEKNVLFPNSLELLSDSEWKEISAGDAEIGWMLKDAPPIYRKANEQQPEYIHPSQDFSKKELSFSTEDKIKLDEGYLSPEQVDLLLKTLPLDITYVDENDKVIFYNRGEERVFPRSPGIIGREVRFCHPPKSVGTVLKILEEFRKGTQSQADFWFNYRGSMLYIRYFAVRDAQGAYKGVIEMSQDITHIQTLKGEQRLLDWE